MQNQQYKEALEEAVYTLHEAENQLFTTMVNIGFSGVYEDISKLHEPGESINLELAMFENTDDANLDLMVEVITNIVRVKNSIMNLNNLDINLEEEDEGNTDEDENEEDSPL
jgi:hypothetical protein